MKKDRIKEVFTVNPFQGAVAALFNISKKGYRVVKIDRKGNEAKITLQRVKGED